MHTVNRLSAHMTATALSGTNRIPAVLAHRNFLFGFLPSRTSIPPWAALQGRLMTSEFPSNTVKKWVEAHDNVTGTPNAAWMQTHIDFRAKSTSLSASDLAWMRTNLKPGDQVIDFGTGAGLGAQAAASVVGRSNVIAVDIDSKTIESLQADPKLAGINFVRSDQLGGIVDGGSAQYIRAKNVTPYMDDTQLSLFFKDVSTALKADGAFNTSLYHTSQMDSGHVTRRSIQEFLVAADRAGLVPQSLSIQADKGSGARPYKQFVCGKEKDGVKLEDACGTTALDDVANKMAAKLDGDYKQVKIVVLFKLKVEPSVYEGYS